MKYHKNKALLSLRIRFAVGGKSKHNAMQWPMLSIQID